MNFKEWFKLDEGQRFDAFKRWYDFHRGNWSDVERVLRKYPQAQKFLDRIEGELRDGHFDRFADPLMKTVDKLIPGHAKYNNSAWDNQNQAPKQSTQVGPNTPTRAARPLVNQEDTPTSAHGIQAQSPGPSSAFSPAVTKQKNNSPMNFDSPQLTNVMTSFERRLANIERLLMQRQG